MVVGRVGGVHPSTAMTAAPQNRDVMAHRGKNTPSNESLYPAPACVSFIIPFAGMN